MFRLPVFLQKGGVCDTTVPAAIARMLTARKTLANRELANAGADVPGFLEPILTAFFLLILKLLIDLHLSRLYPPGTWQPMFRNGQAVCGRRWECLMFDSGPNEPNIRPALYEIGSDNEVISTTLR